MSVYKPLSWFLHSQGVANEKGVLVFLNPRITFLFGDYKRRTEAEVAEELKAARRRNLRIDFKLYVLPALIIWAGSFMALTIIPWLFSLPLRG